MTIEAAVALLWVLVALTFFYAVYWRNRRMINADVAETIRTLWGWYRYAMIQRERQNKRRQIVRAYRARYHASKLRYAR